MSREHGDAPRTRSLASRPAHLVVQRFGLSVIAGPDKKKSFTSAGARTVIGTEAGADVVLTDPHVSRFHVEIQTGGGRAILRDLGSRNGTAIDGVAVIEAELRDGQTIAIGESKLRFDLGTQRAKIALSPNARFGALVGESAVMRTAFAMLERAAATDSTVLLEGETGTGKEAAAESIHRASPRRDGPLVVVDCSAIPANLLESELFGHERGAYTGAVGSREGAFELAAGGTIFLDEIGELPIELQPKLLGALERREVKRVGGTRPVALDARVVAATNRNLRREVNHKRFRSDLYYRLAVIEIRLPPLRERLEDLPVVTEAILEQLGAGARPEAAALRSEAFLAELAGHRWSGNVRELRNYLERCLALGRQPLEPDEPVPGDGGTEGSPLVDPSQPIQVNRERWTGALERAYVDAVLRMHGGNVTAAAKAAGLGRVQFYRLLWRHGLR
jgi:transcriptional regulator with PAS, ATPase and Fis domain